ncbi:MAG: M48 family metallopeptidase [Bacteroidales bacterium]|jgi:hypothetical protein|nr:M48 family metallopeptidase [Bacteroidales bacterium]
MRKIIITLLVLWTCCGFICPQEGISQTLELYSEGEMPPAMADQLKHSNDGYLKYLCQKGKLVYGSSVNRYLETILDNLLVNEPQLKDQLTILVVKSPTVNASVSPEGIILVHIGLIAQVTNEAELAFVLSHELIHFVLKHSSIKDDAKKSMESYLQRHAHSREQESEADIKGIDRFFAASKYSYGAFDGAFDVLQYGNLPFDNIAFDRNVFENNYYQFPDKYFLQNTNPVSNRDDYVDTLATHPNIAKRRLAANAVSARKDTSGRSLFIQDEALFADIQNRARIECINQWLVQHRFIEAFYNAWIMSATPKTNVEQSFLQKAMAIAVYGISKHKMAGSLRDIMPKMSEIEGEQHAVFYFFHEITRQEVTALALRMMWKVRQDNPDDPFLSNICKDIVGILTGELKFGLNDFCDYPMGTPIDSISEPEPQQEVQSGNKYDRIKLAAPAKVKPSIKFKTVNYMLADLKVDTSFTTFFQQSRNEVEDESVLALLAQNKNVSIVEEEMVFFSPFYAYYNRKRDYIEKKSHRGSTSVKKTMEQSAKRLKLSFFLIDNTQFTTEQYNTYCLLYQLIEYIAGVSEGIVPYYNVDMKGFSSQAKYVVLTYTSMNNENRVTYSKIQDIVLSAFCCYTAPLQITRLFFPRHSSRTSMIVLNVNTGKSEFARTQITEKVHCAKSLNNAFIYDCLRILKKGEKDEK